MQKQIFLHEAADGPFMNWFCFGPRARGKSVNISPGLASLKLFILFLQVKVPTN